MRVLELIFFLFFFPFSKNVDLLFCTLEYLFDGLFIAGTVDPIPGRASLVICQSCIKMPIDLAWGITKAAPGGFRALSGRSALGQWIARGALALVVVGSTILCMWRFKTSNGLLEPKFMSQFQHVLFFSFFLDLSTSQRAACFVNDVKCYQVN
jgi:hypothetical protein